MNKFLIISIFLAVLLTKETRLVLKIGFKFWFDLIKKTLSITLCEKNLGKTIGLIALLLSIYNCHQTKIYNSTIEDIKELTIEKERIQNENWQNFREFIIEKRGIN